MADSLLKVLAFNDEVKAVAMVATDAIAEAQRRHDTWSSATAALGRTIIGTQLLASWRKNHGRCEWPRGNAWLYHESSCQS